LREIRWNAGGGAGGGRRGFAGRRVPPAVLEYCAVRSHSMSVAAAHRGTHRPLLFGQ
jgi:hypothetical protein